MSHTRAKFKCVEISKREGWGGVAIHHAAKLHVVHGDSEENKQFFASSPTGSIEISTVRAFQRRRGSPRGDFTAVARSEVAS